MRTRVHNNAGSEAVIRESFQINIDVTRQSDLSQQGHAGGLLMLFRSTSQTVDRQKPAKQVA